MVKVDSPTGLSQTTKVAKKPLILGLTAMKGYGAGGHPAIENSRKKPTKSIKTKMEFALHVSCGLEYESASDYESASEMITHKRPLS